MDIEQLYALYVKDLYRYIYSLCRHPQTAEDLLQDTFYKAHVSLLSKSIHDVKPWLFKVAYYTYIDYCRKSSRTLSTEKIEQVEHATPETIWLQQDSYMKLLNLMDALSPLEKQSILLCDLQECSYEQAAMILDLKLNTLKSHLSRGRKKMRGLIQKED